MTLTIGKTYRFTDGNHAFRVFLVAPSEDLAIVAAINCSSTRLRQASLGAFNEGLASGLIASTPDPYKPALPAKVRGIAAQKSFARIRPALEELWSLGVYALSCRPLWPDIKRLARQVGVTPSTLNKAFSDVVQAGGVLEAAIPRWNFCGRKPSTGKADYPNRATDQPDSFALQDKDYRNIAAGVRKFLRGAAFWEEAYDRFLVAFYPGGEATIGGIKAACKN